MTAIKPSVAPRLNIAKSKNEPKKVIIMPAEAKSLNDARELMEDSQDLFESVGLQDTKEIMRAAALTSTVSLSQQEALEAAGFQVIEDKIVQQATQEAKSVRDLRPGWLLNRFPLIGGPFDPFAPLRPEPRPMPQRRPQKKVRAQSSEGPMDYIGKLPTTGKGVTIAVLDTGVAEHPDLADRLVANVSAVHGNRGYDIGDDPVGHGTHVAADAAGDGAMSGGRLAGPAPDSDIVGIQVLAEGADPAPMSTILEEFTNGVEWMIQNKERYGIRVANMSLGFPLQLARDRYSGARFLFDPIASAISDAVESGIVVVAAAGNDGYKGGIDDSPAMVEEVITVGALDTNGTPSFKGDDYVADFSSRGKTPDGRIKPDVVAPGVDILAANSPGSMISNQNNQAKQMIEAVSRASDRELQLMIRRMVRRRMMPRDALYLHPSEIREILTSGLQVKDSAGSLAGDTAYLAMSGTSMAAPIVSGVIAAMLEANPALNPADVKKILKGTANPLRGEPVTSQGAGAIDAQEAIEVARNYKPSAPRPKVQQPVRQPVRRRRPARPSRPQRRPVRQPVDLNDLFRQLFG